MQKWALVSVFEKAGVLEFCQRLVALGYGILSTGGTARHLMAAGVPVTQVDEYTGFPEMMDGRVKTLHPKIHGGLLGVRDEAHHVESMKQHEIAEIDLVVVNLYPFEETIAKPNVTFPECVEMIDIGGPSMLRSAAKNHRFVLPVIDPADYTWLADKLEAGTVTIRDRQKLAAKVFNQTAAYDARIAAYLLAHPDGGQGDATAVEPSVFPIVYQPTFISRQNLRYGENPHQAAHFYAEVNARPATIAAARQLQGKELSFNNIQDADAALNILRAFDDMNRPAAVAVKHMNPCGIGLGETLIEAYLRAYEADSISIFGGIVALNRPVDADVASRLTELFLEIVIAPAFTDEALALFARKKNVRLLTVEMSSPLWLPGEQVYRRVSGGLLVQVADASSVESPTEWNVVTTRQPSVEENTALQFAWRTVKYVKSNAIVLTSGIQTLGIGAGQMNRVGAAQIAIAQAASRATGSVMGSDAFFPMRDTVDAAAAAGVTAIVQPGGSIRDEESILAANEHGIAMVFTNSRHFLH